MKTNSVKKNFAYQFIYNLLAVILPFITSPYIARVIGPDGLGIYSYTYSVAYYFVLISMLGITNYGNRSIAQARNDRKNLNIVFSNLLAVHVLISLLCIGCYGIYAAVAKENKIYILLQGLFVISALFDISWFYFGIENFKLTVIRNILIKTVNVVCIFLFVKDAADLWKYCLIMALGILLSQLSLWLPLKKYVSFVMPNRKNMLIHVKPLLMLFIPTIAVSLYKYMDKIMIGSMSGNQQLGYYENAEKLINLALTFISSFATVMLPKMSYIAALQKKDTILKYIRISMEFIMCAAFALGWGLAGVSRVFAPVFWGEEFKPCSSLIMGLALTIPFISFANVIRTQYLIPYKMDKEYTISVTMGAVVNLCMNMLLIPGNGAQGAMVGTILAEISVCMLQAYMVRKELNLGNYVKYAFLFCVIGGGMFLLIRMIERKLGIGWRTLCIQVLAGALFYLLCSFLFFMHKKNEVIFNIINKMKKRK